MKVAYRFVMKSYLGPMILTFFIVMFILLMHYLWMHIDDLVGKGLSMSVIMELIMYAAATLIPMGLPLATLMASIMTMGRLGENNELLALKAAGISLPRITRPLVVVMVVVSTGSFFVMNNLTPFSYQKMYTLLSDISKQRQEMKFTDGIFFNGIPDMSIRVETQDAETDLLHNVLIYDNTNRTSMRTTIADSGYIKITSDRKYLEVILFDGEVYEENRNYNWYNKNVLSHHIFDRQDMLVPISGFALERSEMDGFASNSKTKNMEELSHDIDSLRYSRDSLVLAFTGTFIKTHAFKELQRYPDMDSLPALNMPKEPLPWIDTMGTKERQKIFSDARDLAASAQSFVKYESRFPVYTSNLLYRAQADYQSKLALPFSIMIFFLIGSALGAIIRRGGLGMPIVVSVIFFVIYHIISITGNKFVEDGAMHPFIGMWLSSIVLFPVAVFLTIKSTNDSALLNKDAYVARYKKVKNYIIDIYKRKIKGK
ncbi:MAG: LptF/LptG family permease [Rikenellaceae bacterium]